MKGGSDLKRRFSKNTNFSQKTDVPKIASEKVPYHNTV